MQRRFEQSFPKKQFKNEIFSYTFPYNYRDSFVGAVKYPCLITQEEYLSDVKKVYEYFQNNRITVFSSNRESLKQVQSEDETKHYIQWYHTYRKIFFGENPVTDIKYIVFKEPICQYYGRVCYEYERFIYAFYYKRKLEEVKQNSAIKMFSTDATGWRHYPYDITENIKISVKTNFAYGSAAYFFCNLKYMDIDILPYSAVVNYYRVKWNQFLRYTRKYEPECRNWENALRFVSEVSNMARHDVEKFVNVWIYKELHTMVKGLHNLIDNPDSDPGIMQIKKLDLIDKTSQIKKGLYRLVVDCTEDDVREYEALPNEKIVAYKAEKISGCIKLLGNLRQLKGICEYAGDCIEEIKKMNIQIIPEIEQCLENIAIRTQRLKSDLVEVNHQFAKAEKQHLICRQKYYQEIKSFAISLSKGTGFFYNRFMKDAESAIAHAHPDLYDSLEKKVKLQDQCDSIKKRIYFLNNFKISLNSKLKVINNHFVKK